MDIENSMKNELAEKAMEACALLGGCEGYGFTPDGRQAFIVGVAEPEIENARAVLKPLSAFLGEMVKREAPNKTITRVTDGYVNTQFCRGYGMIVDLKTKLI